jgi:hypothetical protein
VPHGVNQATKDPGVIETWWRRFPLANEAIATGQVSGLHGLDVDPRHGGDETLRELIAQHGPLASTPEVVTGSGGRHIYFAAPSSPIGCPPLAEGVDSRGNGGFLVSPPSLRVSGRRYRWELSSLPSETPLAPLPAWVVSLLTTANPQKPLADTVRQLPLGKPALDFVANGAPVGRQRVAAVAAARNYLSAGHTVGQTAAALWRGFQASPVGDPARPWTYEDALAIAQDLAARPAPALAHGFGPLPSFTSEVWA